MKISKKSKKSLANHPCILLGEFIKNQRIKLAITLREFSKITTFDLSTLSNFELGLGPIPTINEIKVIGTCLCLNNDGARKLGEFWGLAKLHLNSNSPLKISDIMTKEEARPVFVKFESKEKEDEFFKILGFE